MDYVVGSVAALVTGNVTPSRPRLLKRALTPTKHQASPNVTPKSELVDDRSIFLSPSMQKKKAIVKKSPKRIFQNPDLEVTDNGEGNLSTSSPKADKVKKHLKDDLDIDSVGNKNTSAVKSPKGKGKNISITMEAGTVDIVEQKSNENTPTKKKRKTSSVNEQSEVKPSVEDGLASQSSACTPKSPKNMKERRKSLAENESNKENDIIVTENKPATVNHAAKSPKKQASEIDKSGTESNKDEPTNVNANKKKKNKKRKKKLKPQNTDSTSVTTDGNTEKLDKESVDNTQNNKKKNRKRKKGKPVPSKPEPLEADKKSDQEDDSEIESKKSKTTVNPNAVTDKESDSEHESDDDIESENEEINKEVFAAEQADESSDEEDLPKEKEKPQKIKDNVAEKNTETKEKPEVITEDEIKRTIFVGNVLFNPKCKKEIKKIFNTYGQIETVRIRTVPVKDARSTAKLAVIKNELHPERTTVNVYVKFVDEASVEKALVENNTVLNEHHLRVSRSSHTGAEHDPKCSIFVGNLPFSIEDEILREKFVNCGEIHSVRVVRDKRTNAGKGFGYVNFESKDGVELALSLTEEDLTIKNRIIRVKRCTQLTPKQKQNSNKKKVNQRPQNAAGQKNQEGQNVQNSQKFNQGGPRGNNGFQRGNQGTMRQNRGGQNFNEGGPKFNRGGQNFNQGGPKFNRGGQNFNQGSQPNNRGGQRFNQGDQKRQGFQRDGQSFQRGNQGFQRGNQRGPRPGNNDQQMQDGAHRRIMQKRTMQDGGNDGPPNKKPNISQPVKEKKPRKEFVGMTGDKKKKRKFDKGLKKKKALSEILTK